MSKNDMYKTIMLDCNSSKTGVYRLTSIEVFAINKMLPFGTKLELEKKYKLKTSKGNSYKSKKRWDKRLRESTIKSTINSKKRTKIIKRLIYKGKPQINPFYLTIMKCKLVMKKINDNPNSIPFKDNENFQSVPSLDLIEQKINDYCYASFYDFKKDLRGLWLYFYTNYENNKDIVKLTSLMSRFSEENFDVIESLTEEEVQKECDSFIIKNNNNNNSSFDISNEYIHQQQKKLENNYIQEAFKYMKKYPENKSEVNEKKQLEFLTPNMQNSFISTKNELYSIQSNSHNNNNNNNSIIPSIDNINDKSSESYPSKDINYFKPKNQNNSIDKDSNNINNTQKSQNIIQNSQNSSIYYNNNNINNNSINYFNSSKQIKNLNNSMNNDDLGSKNKLTYEEKNKMKNQLKSLSPNQLKGIIPLLQDYFDQNNMSNSKYFEVDIDKLNPFQFIKLKNYVSECKQENENKQQLENIPKSQVISFSNQQNFNNIPDNISSFFLYQTGVGTNILNKGQNNQNRLNCEFNNSQNNISGINSSFYNPITIRSNRNENNTSNILTGNNHLMTNWNANYQTTTTVNNNYLHLRPVNNSGSYNANQNNDNLSDSGSFDFH